MANARSIRPKKAGEEKVKPQPVIKNTPDQLDQKAKEARGQVFEAEPFIDEEVEAKSKELIAQLNEKIKKKRFRTLSRRQRKKRSLKQEDWASDLKVKNLILGGICVVALVLVSGFFIWIASVNSDIKLSNYFNPTISCLVANTTNIEGEQVPVTRNLKSFTKKKLKAEDYLDYGNLVFKLKNDANTVKVKTIQFDIKVKGKGWLALRFYIAGQEIMNPLDGQEVEHKFKNNGSLKGFRLPINHTFSTSSTSDFAIYIYNDTNRTEPTIQSFAIYNLKMYKK